MLALTPAQEQFVLQWSEVGVRWGINRTVARVHALLYVTAARLSAEEIAGALGVSRSGLSTALRELQDWGLVKVIHLPKDRREHFEAVQDVWELFLRVMDERKRREVDPALEVLRNGLREAERGGRPDGPTRERLRGMLEFCEILDGCYGRFRRMSRQAALRWIRMGDRVQRFLEAMK
jgi:DNA-binding transcriptional regulator GbsR (MarR family)